jgi:hypothetical protein
MSYLDERRKYIEAGRPLKTKEKKAIAKKSAKRIEKEKEQKASGVKEVSKLELDVWFADIQKKHTVGVGGFACMECGDWIYAKFARSAIAHLLPKKLFKSVATHELNYLILGAGCGCHEKSHRIDKFCQMKIWPEAARRIKIMIPLLPFDELKYLSNQLLTALDNS